MEEPNLLHPLPHHHHQPPPAARPPLPPRGDLPPRTAFVLLLRTGDAAGDSVIGLSRSDVFLGVTSILLDGTGFSFGFMAAFLGGVVSVLCDMIDGFLHLIIFSGGVVESARGICLGFLDFEEVRGILMILEGLPPPSGEDISSNSACCR